MVIRTFRAACWLVGVWAVLLPGCKPAPDAAPAPAPAPVSTSWVQSVRKLDGGPARVRETQFAPDGASILVLEKRHPRDEDADKPTFSAISRRPVAGGPAKDLIASEMWMSGFAPLGDGIVVLQHPPLPAVKADSPDEYDRDDYFDALRAALEKAALYRVTDGGEPVRVSPEGRRCSNLVGAAGGQWVAFSVAPEPKGTERYAPFDSAEEEIHVLGAKPGEAITLAIKGVLRELSPDGARILMRRPPAKPDGDAGPDTPRRRDAKPPSDDAAGLVMVSVKDHAVTDLPASLKVDGADVDTAGLSVTFSGDGLLFRSKKGDIYASALDGSSARRLAGALPDTGDRAATGAGKLGDAGAPTDAGDPGDAGSPPQNPGDPADAGALPADAGALPAKPLRVVGPKGTVFELREEAGSVVLSSLGAGEPGPTEPIAKLEGPLSAFGAVKVDAAEKRVALAILSDTSRDGLFDATFDDAEVFLTDAAPGSLAFGRGPVASLADELKPKVAAAAGISESGVNVVPSDLGSVKVTAELPWIQGEKAKALFDRALIAARAITGAVTQKRVEIHLRVGKLDLTVYRYKDGDGRPYVVLAGRGIWVADPEALPLVLRNPVRSSLYFSSNETLTGALENTGKEPTPTIEAFAVVSRGYGDSRTSTEVTKKMGVIEPGKRAKYSLILMDVGYGRSPSARFRAGGKRLAVFNQYAYEHSIAWLDTALEVHAAHGVWSEDGRADGSFSPTWWLVHLTAEQAALPDGARDKLLRAIAGMLIVHGRRFHSSEFGSYGVKFAAPGGGGWKFSQGTKIARYEAADEKPGAGP